MNEIDERQQQRDKERARQEEEERLAEQLRHTEALVAVRRGQVRLLFRTITRIISVDFTNMFYRAIRTM